MNKIRRKALEKIESMICEARNLLEEITEEEQEAFDNMPESLQYSERGEAMEEGLYTLQEALEALEEIESNLEEIVNG